MQESGKIWKFRKIWENFKNLGHFENIQIFGNYWEILTIENLEKENSK